MGAWRAVAGLAVLVGVGCGTPESEVCRAPCDWTTVKTDDSCVVALACASGSPSVSCVADPEEGWLCECSSSDERLPVRFWSPDFCDLRRHTLVCEAMTRCWDWTYD